MLQILDLDIAGVPTTVRAFGTTPQQAIQNATDLTDIVVVIPGNPGITGVYDQFLKTLHERLGWPIWILGHAGHDVPKNERAIGALPPLEGNEKLYALHGQIYHKVYFVEKYVPKNVRVHLIGHSIGSYIILQMLRTPSIKSKTSGAYLLFPTFEYLSESTNGRFLTLIVARLVWMLSIVFFFLSFFPNGTIRFFVTAYCSVFISSLQDIEPIIDIVNYNTLSMIWHMAEDEMKRVKERDDEVLTENKKILKLYYGSKDGWVPISYYEKIKKDHPDLDVQLCEKNYSHAFVIKNSVDVGNMVADWIKPRT